MFSLRSSFLILILVFIFSSLVVAQSKLEKGLILYEKGDYANAVKILKRDKKNISSLYYLGLSYEKLDNQKRAEKAFEKSFNRGVVLVGKQLTSKDIGSKEARSEIKEKHGRDIENAYLSSQEYAKLKPEIRNSSGWRQNQIVINLFREKTGFSEKLFFKDEVTSLVEIISKPKPGYTTAARRNGITGKVEILVGFLKTGEIGFSIPLRGLQNGLTEKSVSASRNISFKPAMKDDEPVSFVTVIEYDFMIY